MKLFNRYKLDNKDKKGKKWGDAAKKVALGAAGVSKMKKARKPSDMRLKKMGKAMGKAALKDKLKAVAGNRKSDARKKRMKQLLKGAKLLQKRGR